MKKSVNSKKNQLLSDLEEMGVQFLGGNRARPHWKKLSSGCLTCMKGTWSCIYINGLCTANCFYCPQERGRKEEREPYVEDRVTLGSPGDYVEFLKAFPFEGVSFSGGEPLLVFDKVLDYLAAIRTRFGNRHYIWLYTNGDLATRERLKRLKDAGLNEIRFDLAARDYDLSRLAMAAEIFGTTTVEIPAIPEDLERVKSLLHPLESLGVKHLNLHQLMVTDHNRERMTQKNYSITHESWYRDFFPIIESELAALEILKYAAENRVGLGVNYCSKCYKDRFQTQGARRRFAPLARKNTDTITATGFIRKIRAADGRDGLGGPLENPRNGDGYGYGDGNTSDVSVTDTGSPVPSDRMNRWVLREPFRNMQIIYENARITSVAEQNPTGAIVMNFGGSKACIVVEDAFRYRLENRVGAIFFKNLFIDGMNCEECAESVLKHFNLGKDRREEILSDVLAFYGLFETMEYLPKGFPDYDQGPQEN